MFGFLLPLPFVGGLGARVAIIVLILYALLPIIRTTVAGMRSVDPALVEAGMALGMTPGQLLRQVELPLALPSIVAGIRVAAVIGVGTATIAAAVGAGGLGEYIFRGLSMVEPTVILAGAVPAALLALTFDGALTLARARDPARDRIGRRAPPRAVLVVGGRGRSRGRGCRRRIAALRPARGRDPRRLEELHRADPPRRAASRRRSRRDRPDGRAPAESRRHVHLRPRAPLRRHRRLRRVLRHRVRPRSSSSRSRPIRARCSTTSGSSYAEAGVTLLDPLGFENTFAILVRGADAPSARSEDDRRRRAARRRRGGPASATSSCSAPTAIPGWRRRTGCTSARRRGDGPVAHLPRARGAAGRPHRRRCDERPDRRLRPGDAGGRPALLPALRRRAASRAARRCWRIPRSRQALRRSAGRITVADMRRMNHAVDAEHRDPAAVVRGSSWQARDCQPVSADAPRLNACGSTGGMI